MTTIVGSASNPPLIEKESAPVVTLYLGDKYAEFYEGFSQIAHTFNSLKPLLNYLKENGWGSNLD
jgi:hypothetical protein